MTHFGNRDNLGLGSYFEYLGGTPESGTPCTDNQDITGLG
jgi:hypothetical protein